MFCLIMLFGLLIFESGAKVLTMRDRWSFSGAVYPNYYGILRGLRPVQPALIRTPSHAGFPAWLVVF
jgi:hypothetical protein